MAISNFISTVWSENLYRELDKQFIAAKHCNRQYEGEIKGKGNKVKVCGIGHVTVQNYTKNSNMSTPQTLDDNAKELTIDQAKYFNFQIDDVDRAQASPKLMGVAMSQAAQTLASHADSYIFSLVSNASSQVYSSLLESPTDLLNKVLDARTILYKNNVLNSDEVVLEVSPEVAAALMREKLDLKSDNSDILESGCIGRLYGVRVFVSSNIKETETQIDIETEEVHHHCLMRTTRAIAYAEQLSEIEAYRPELRFADAVKGLLLYGAKVIYPNEMVELDITVREKN